MEIKEGEIIEGIVLSIKKYGAFLSFEDNYIGLLHISEISSKFVSNIFDYFKIGDKISVIVKDVDHTNKKISVTLKGLPNNLNPYKLKEETKKITRYIKEIDFQKIEKTLPNMISDELERESKLEGDKNDKA